MGTRKKENAKMRKMEATNVTETAFHTSPSQSPELSMNKNELKEVCDSV